MTVCFTLFQTFPFLTAQRADFDCELVNINMANNSEQVPWNEAKVFRYFNFTDEEIKRFTLDPSAGYLVNKERKNNLKFQLVYGKCKTCPYNSRVEWGNPCNWVRHLNNVSRFIFQLFVTLWLFNLDICLFN